MRRKVKRMTAVFTAFLMVLGVFAAYIPTMPAYAGIGKDYVALDSQDPVQFNGDTVVYGGETITLGPKAIYLDGQLSDAEAGQYPYVYNDFNAAMEEVNTTSEKDVTVYIAPYVYWIDDPEATDTVEPTAGLGAPYGVIISDVTTDGSRVTYTKRDMDLNFVGLTKDPYNVVIAGNRGQSHASHGNYTMFYFNVNNLELKNLTIGNYCSIDLEYPLKPELNHARRTSTITQAQLGSFRGDKFYADNCNFLSRLNLMPISGGKRSLYNKCHFESTDDSLNGYAVYLDCDFDFYGNMPFGGTSNSGAVLLNCVFNSNTINAANDPNQYFCKVGGPVVAVDCNYKTNYDFKFGFGWTKYPAVSLRCYQYNITNNGNPITIGSEGGEETVDMTGKSILDAYRVEVGGKVYYNTYNLLAGSDDWDPMGVKDIIVTAGKTDIATLLTTKTSAKEIESGVTTADLSSTVKYFDNTVCDTENVTWTMKDADKAYATLKDNGDGTASVTGINNEDETKTVVFYASTASGLESAVSVDIKPTVLDAPTFIEKPVITKDGGKLVVNYKLDLGTRADMSLISWYRCSDAQGSDPVLVAVTRLDDPEYQYELTLGDVGKYLKAVVEPKNIRSEAGAPVEAMYTEAIQVTDVKTVKLSTDFQNFPTARQDKVLPGYWTVDSFKPADADTIGTWKGDETSPTPWAYGFTGDGCVGSGLYQGVQGARLMYTPVEGKYGDMTLKFQVDPAKTAGQGFGSAGQYMDICIKYDTTTLTGYGLRIIRTKAASNAVTFVLIKSENGIVTEISDVVIASCYATGCEITLKAEGTKLTAHVETPTPQLADQITSGWVHQVDLTADITASDFGGVGIQHTGTTGTGGWQNTTMFHKLDVEWAGLKVVEPEVPVEPEQPKDPAPSTGDTTPIMFYILMCAGAITVLFVALKKRRAVR